MARYFLLSLIILGIFISCKHALPDQNTSTPGGGTGGGGTGGGGTGGGGTAGNCNPNIIYFKKDVLPILVNNCGMSPCHDPGTAKKGVVLTSYASVMTTADVDKGNPLGSKLYKVLIDDDPADRMPRNAPALPDSLKQIIYKWIQQGAQDLTCNTGCDNTAPSTYNLTVKPIIAAKCTGCHGGTNPQGGINLTTYGGLKAKITDGRFWGAINHSQGFSAMPKFGEKLSDCDLAKIKKWLDAGSIEN